jgi:hypothetical protein
LQSLRATIYGSLKLHQAPVYPHWTEAISVPALQQAIPTKGSSQFSLVRILQKVKNLIFLFSKSQHGEEAFPPGVPAPRLSIVAATSQLPNIMGNLHNASMLSNESAKNYEECSIEVDDDDNASYGEPSPKKIKVEENEFDEEALTIDEL